MNDRYRVERSGKTRKSASSAKPKRAAGESASSAPAKKKSSKPAAKRAGLFGGGGSRQSAVRVEATPEMKKLRRWWWVCMGVAIVLALVMVPTSGLKNRTYDSVLFGAYALALGGALYLEFGPLRKARTAALAAQKSSGKGKSAQGKKPQAQKTPDPEPAAASAGGGLSGFASRVFGRKKPDADAESDGEGKA